DIADRAKGKFNYGNAGKVVENSPHIMKYWRDHASYPFQSHDLWFMTEDIRWGKYEAAFDSKALIAKVNREDMWRDAAKTLAAYSKLPDSDPRKQEAISANKDALEHMAQAQAAALKAADVAKQANVTSAKVIAEAQAKYDSAKAQLDVLNKTKNDAGTRLQRADANAKVDTTGQKAKTLGTAAVNSLLNPKPAPGGNVAATVPSTALPLATPAVPGAPLIGHDGASLIGHDGASVTSKGGGNIVAAGGGNVVAAGGGNIVAAGGGNLLSEHGAGLISEHGAGLISNAAAALAA
ncbi:hypothetical protein KXV85_000254, partial [Aspergillus fumigatus]